MVSDLIAWLRDQIGHEAAWDGGHPPEGRVHRAICDGTLTVNDARWCSHAESLVRLDRAAKLAIIDEYEARDKDADLMLGPPVPRQREWEGLGLAVRIIAVGYQRRRGYRQEWKP